MPPKRKALAIANENIEAAVPPAKKVAKGVVKGAASATVNSAKGKGKETDKAVKKVTASKKSSKGIQGTKGSKKQAETSEPKAVSKAPNAPKPDKFKYSNADTLIKTPAPEFVSMAWQREEEDDDEGDEEPGDPKVGDILTEEMVKRVSRMGYPITEDGVMKFEWMMDEQDKRDQDLHGMYIYNDFTGYGIGEVIQNLLAEFNKILFKKNISPFKKWAFVEALASFFKISCIDPWVGIDDSEGLMECIDMIGTMVLTTLDMLSEHDLLSDSASSPLPNISITMLLILEFVKEYGEDLEVMWAHEIVRQLDRAGVELKLRKEVRVSQEYIDELRAKYMQNEEEDLYETHAGIENWEPDDDREPDEFGDSIQRKWARWDWKKEFAKFKEDHPAGNHYNLEKWSKSDKAPYTFGTKEFEESLTV